ncbi:MAG: nitrilase-related carbon-nitrogen hydrolase [Bdellovibrionales bacterium]
MSDTLKAALVQLQSVNDFSKNKKTILNLLNSVELSELDIVFLPENALYMRLDKKTLPPQLSLEDPLWDKFIDLVADHKTALHFGGVGMKGENDRAINASVFIEPGQSPKVSYVKRSLFDIELDGHSYRESDAFEAGTSNNILNYKNWSFGQSICFDLRFSKQFWDYALSQVDVILVPSSFLVPTGKAHWHTLLKARAIESQAYLIAAAQSGDHLGRHQSFGHSLVIGPWGEIIEDLGESVPRIQKFILDRKPLMDIRKRMPMNRSGF